NRIGEGRHPPLSAPFLNSLQVDSFMERNSSSVENLCTEGCGIGLFWGAQKNSLEFGFIPTEDRTLNSNLKNVN
ncbi:MAG TPA: hypothetical protein VNJ07_00790, partial [Chitinophagales bacterium]|nr:hypothetical protein [Chitinophagales bacterium]